MMYSIPEEFRQTITQVFDLLGKPLDPAKYQIVDRGQPHVPAPLPPGKMGIYSFFWQGHFLKIGKAGPKSRARFLSQHYNPHSASSTLAASLIRDPQMADFQLEEHNIAQWIKTNCRRVDILLDESLGIFTLELVEAILHYRYEPRYEGFASQR